MKSKKAFWKSGTVVTGLISISLAAGSAYQSGATWQGIALAVLGAAAIFFRSIAKTTVAWSFFVQAVEEVHSQIHKGDDALEIVPEEDQEPTPIPPAFADKTKKERR